ncbi:hypothetical protein ACPA54_27685 [Uniformispora flossi]|uniref:hypothetical protein n=1 Tax=Uniformispora flossi TaxID=3390723 RepID=UPI003C2CBC17
MALPLVIAAVVCLLATSGVWLFRGGDSGKDKTPIGLNVPSVTVSQPEPTQVPATDAASPSTTATAAASSSAKPTTKAPTTKPPSTTAKPPTSAPPVTTAPPKPYAASSSAFARDNGFVAVTVTVSNPNNVPLGTWTVRLSGRRMSDAQLISGPPDARGSDTGAAGTGPVAGGSSFRLLFTMRFRGDTPPSTMRIEINGTASDVSIDDASGW